MEELPKLLTSPANSALAAGNESRFVEVLENNESIDVDYEPPRMIEYVEDVSVPTTRLSYEAALKYLEETTKPCVNFISLSAPEHWEHCDKILRTCTQFKEIGFSNISPSPINSQIYNWLKMKSIEKENNIIHVNFTKEVDEETNETETDLYFRVQRNGLHIQCTIVDHENIVYGQLLDYLKVVANKNNVVQIRLDGAEFKELFDKIGWQHDVVMEENISNGVATTISVMNDTNIYSLEYWIPIMQKALCKMDMTLYDTSSWYLTDKALV